MAGSAEDGGHARAGPVPPAVGPGERPRLGKTRGGRHAGRDAEDLHATGGDSLHEVTHRELDADAVEVLRPAGYPCTWKFKEP